MTAHSGSVLILGATSDIARATARIYARAGRALILAARQSGRLHADAEDLKIRSNAEVHVVEWDVLAPEPASDFADRIGQLPSTIICVVGLLGVQQESETHAETAGRVMASNYSGPALVLQEFANRMAVRGSGVIIGISSVAGDRGRASNYIYGSAKAGFTAFLSGLRARFSRSGVHVITVKPGFVDTRVTEGMKLPPLLTAQPAEVGEAIFKADMRGRNVIYVRPIWRLVMLIIAHIPETIFKRLRF